MLFFHTMPVYVLIEISDVKASLSTIICLEETGNALANAICHPCRGKGAKKCIYTACFNCTHFTLFH